MDWNLVSRANTPARLAHLLISHSALPVKTLLINSYSNPQESAFKTPNVHLDYTWLTHKSVLTRRNAGHVLRTVSCVRISQDSAPNASKTTPLTRYGC